MFNERTNYPQRRNLFRFLIVVLVGGLLMTGIDRLGGLDWLRSIGEQKLVLPVRQLLYNRRAAGCVAEGVFSPEVTNLTLELKVNQLTEENNQLSKLLGLIPSGSPRFIKTQIIGVSGDSMIISSGSEKGVRIGMVSIAAEEKAIFVGRVTKVTPGQAEITLPSEYDSRLSVLIVPNDSGADKVFGRGLLVGRGSGQVSVEQILNQEMVKTGDLVAYQHKDNLYIVGQIAMVKPEDGGIFKSASVKPIIETRKLLTVVLID